ncbi:hypothetical protein A4A49_07495 [Nicotiana attenuata]|uniref:Uncharacterized protein n=1 Tax=Nicotiana attenuata TaxID=49451 RepID=A0A314LD58_NICAT|nr:hypothetical protein A4A49_07495 [Nicotiana attenuata]
MENSAAGVQANTGALKPTAPLKHTAGTLKDSNDRVVTSNKTGVETTIEAAGDRAAAGVHKTIAPRADLNKKSSGPIADLQVSNQSKAGDRAEYEEEENWENGADDELDDSVELESGQQQRRPNSQEAAYDGQFPRQHPISFMAGQQQQITGSLLQQQHNNASTSSAIPNMALISDHDRALLDTLDSPKPHRCAYSTGSKPTSQKMKVSVAKRHEPCSAKRMNRHEPLGMVIQEEANKKLEANLHVAISDEAEEDELIESATSGDFSPKHSEKKGDAKFK